MTTKEVLETVEDKEIVVGQVTQRAAKTTSGVKLADVILSQGFAKSIAGDIIRRDSTWARMVEVSKSGLLSAIEHQMQSSVHTALADIDLSSAFASIGAPPAIANIGGVLQANFQSKISLVAEQAIAKHRSMFTQIATQQTAYFRKNIASASQAVLKSIKPAVNVIGIGFRRLTCAFALRAVYEGDEEHIDWFAKNVLQEPADYRHATAGTLLENYWTWAVAQALHERRWLDADNPVAYLQLVAQRIAWKRYYEEAPFIWAPDKDKTVSLDKLAFHGTPIGTLIPDPRNQIAGVEINLYLRTVCQQIGLSPEELELLMMWSQGIPRRELHIYLEWSEKKVARVWKSQYRKRKRWHEKRTE